MYLFYLDESGNPSGWNDQDNFVLGAVAIHEGQVRSLSEQLDAVQQQFFPSIQVPIEFHAAHLFHRKGRVKKWPEEQRVTLLNAAYQVISNSWFPHLIAFISAIHISAVQDPAQAFRDCLENICGQFNDSLVRAHKAGHPNKGMLIVDRSGRDLAIRQLVAEFQCKTSEGKYLGNIIDVPYFADSAHTRMLQLADLVAFAGGRYFNRNDSTYLDMILESIAKPFATGKAVGLQHITGSSYDCPCIARH